MIGTHECPFLGFENAQAPRIVVGYKQQQQTTGPVAPVCALAGQWVGEVRAVWKVWFSTHCDSVRIYTQDSTPVLAVRGETL